MLVFPEKSCRCERQTSAGATLSPIEYSQTGLTSLNASHSYLWSLRDHGENESHPIIGFDKNS